MTVTAASQTQAVRHPVGRADAWLRQWLAQHPGAALPSELELVARLGVSRSTVRTVLKQLEAQGLVECLGRRQGRRAAERPRHRGVWARTVVVLSPARIDPFTKAHTGWLEAIEAGAMDALRQHGLYGLLMDAQGLGDVLDDPERLPQGGLVVRDRDSLASVRCLREHGVPTVAYGTEAAIEGVDQVYTDQEAGCLALTRHLLGRGRRRLLRVWTGGGDPWWLCQRDRGYECALREAGLEPLPPLRVPSGDPDVPQLTIFPERIRLYAGFLAEFVLGSNPVDAILSTTDRDVYAIDAALRLLGRTPQEDVDLVGYDNIWETCEERARGLVRPLATVDKQNDLAGREMVRLLLERIAAQDALPARQVPIPPLPVFPLAQSA